MLDTPRIKKGSKDDTLNITRDTLLTGLNGIWESPVAGDDTALLNKIGYGHPNAVGVSLGPNGVRDTALPGNSDDALLGGVNTGYILNGPDGIVETKANNTDIVTNYTPNTGTILAELNKVWNPYGMSFALGKAPVVYRFNFDYTRDGMLKAQDDVGVEMNVVSQQFYSYIGKPQVALTFFSQFTQRPPPDLTGGVTLPSDPPPHVTVLWTGTIPLATIEWIAAHELGHALFGLADLERLLKAKKVDSDNLMAYDKTGSSQLRAFQWLEMYVKTRDIKP
ncbi:MAG: hypothetical protein H6555_06645 [Lewinellaceae bacterium]|nr:hypothetical protein [Lewinellaceae bacterium]